jgi:hypothetical protein
MPRFRLIHGKHQEKAAVLDAQGKPRLDDNGNPMREPRLYSAGDTFDSESDLVAKFNSPGAIKFELVGSPPEASVPAVPAYTTKFPAGQVSGGFQESSGTGATPVGAGTGPAAQSAQAARSGAPAPPPGSPPKGPPVAGETLAARAEREGRPLDDMTLEELREYAADNEVDLKGHTLKADVLKTMKAHRPSK